MRRFHPARRARVFTKAFTIVEFGFGLSQKRLEIERTNAV